MKISHLLSILAFLFAGSLSAQNESNSLSEVRKNNYQVELGFRSIKNIWDNTSNASIIFKKKRQKGNLIEVNAVKYLRAFASFNNQINFTDDPRRMNGDSTEVIFHPSDVIDITAGIGIEKQFQNRKFVHYYGMDVFGRFLNSDDDFTFNSIIGGVDVNNTNTTDRLVRTIKGGLQPFFGLKYYITNQFSVGIESGFEFSYFNTKFTELRFYNVFVNGGNEVQFEELTPVVSNGLKFNYLGIRQITVGYTF